MSETTVTMPGTDAMMAALREFDSDSLSLDRYLYPEICGTLADCEVTSTHIIVMLQMVLVKTGIGTLTLLERMPELIELIVPEPLRQETIDVYTNAFKRLAN